MSNFVNKPEIYREITMLKKTEYTDFEIIKFLEQQVQNVVLCDKNIKKYTRWFIRNN